MSRKGNISREELFWTKVDKNGQAPPHCPELGSCWVWTGYKDRDGYGSFCGQRAHRFAWALTHGKIADGINVLHRCDMGGVKNGCVRESHLFTGTQADNIADKVAKQRQATGDRHGSRTHPERLARGDRSGARKYPEKFRGEKMARKGAANGKAKLVAEDVLTIRRIANMDMTKTEIAHFFGVTPPVIHNIIARRIWRHI